MNKVKEVKTMKQELETTYMGSVEQMIGVVSVKIFAKLPSTEKCKSPLPTKTVIPRGCHDKKKN